MTPRQKFNAVMNFKKPEKTLPVVEWAAWWDKTIDRWRGEGLPAEVGWEESQSWFGLDPMLAIIIRGKAEEAPRPAYHGAPLITDEASYEAFKPYLFTDSIIESARKRARALRDRQLAGELVVRLWLDGFFWFPRTLFGIEPHLLAFYDYPDLMHRMNADLADFNIRAFDAVCEILTPDLMGFAEDMSYNHGPMLSRNCFNEFLLPYYRKVVPHIKARGVRVLVDSDGEVTPMIPWLLDAGVEGVYPLERQSGVDVAAIRKAYPSLLMLGGFDKMTLMRGEAAIRTEFERLLPVMKSGGFIPSMDHQTPPECSFESYQSYLRLFREYAERAVH